MDETLRFFDYEHEHEHDYDFFVPDVPYRVDEREPTSLRSVHFFRTTLDAIEVFPYTIFTLSGTVPWTGHRNNGAGLRGRSRQVVNGAGV